MLFEKFRARAASDAIPSFSPSASYGAIIVLSNAAIPLADDALAKQAITALRSSDGLCRLQQPRSLVIIQLAMPTSYERRYLPYSD
ncbi:hypothetical protein [Bradyrhizobium sp. USDA 4454]